MQTWHKYYVYIKLSRRMRFQSALQMCNLFGENRIDFNLLPLPSPSRVYIKENYAS
jgi:hypothetical protein